MRWGGAAWNVQIQIVKDSVEHLFCANVNLLQYSCLENPMDRGAWWATVCGVTKNWTLLIHPLTPSLYRKWEFKKVKIT